jgi:hypothetical protein
MIPIVLLATKCVFMNSGAYVLVFEATYLGKIKSENKRETKQATKGG